MYSVEDLIRDWPQEFRDGRWVLSRPIDGPWILRVRDAWQVYKGRAEAIQFEDQRLRSIGR